MDLINSLKTKKELIYFFVSFLVVFLSACAGENSNIKDSKTGVRNQLAISDSLLRTDPASALLHVQQALAEADSNNFETLELQGLLLQGKIFHNLNENDQAISSFRKALAMTSIKSKYALCTEAYNYMGVCELKKKNYLSSIINFRKALGYSEFANSPLLFANASEALGDVYAKMHYFNNAVKYYREAQKHYKTGADQDGYFIVLNKIGDLFYLENKVPEAIDRYKKSLLYFTQKQNNKQTAYTYLKIAEGEMVLGKTDKAIEVGLKAREEALKMSDLEILMPVYLVLGKAYFEQKEYKLAKENLLESLQLADILNQDDLRSDAYIQLASVFEGLGEVTKSIAYHKKYQETAEEILKQYEAQESKDILNAIKLDKSQKEVYSLRKMNNVIEKYSSLRSEGLVSNRGFIMLLTAFVIVFILLVAIYYKRFKDKKSASLVLENTVRERTAELNKTLQKLSFHVNNTSLGVIELSPDLRITNWSDQSEKIFGWSRNEVLGDELLKTSFFEKSNYKEVKSVFDKIKKGSLSKKFVLTKSHHKEGRELFIEWNFSVLYTEEGQIISILCFANDVTPREKALLEAETANKELDNFIYKTSHDVKGPIARIEGLINLGLLESQDEVSRNYFKMLEQVSANFNILLSRLFRIHGIYYHEPVAEKLNLKAEIFYLLNKLQKKNALHELKYKIEIPEELHWNTDKLLFYIIIQNIYENALDYRIDGLSMIIFSVDTSNPAYLRLQIRDNGTCIPLQAADRIFDMFFQSTAQSNTAGLGLYMVKKSVEKLGGTIKLLEEQKETVFEIALPSA